MRIWAITKKVLKELWRDKRTLGLMFIAPILIMFLMNVMFSANSSTDVTVGTIGVNKSVDKSLEKVKHVSVKKYYNENHAKEALDEQKIGNCQIFCVNRSFS